MVKHLTLFRVRVRVFATYCNNFCNCTEFHFFSNFIFIFLTVFLKMKLKINCISPVSFYPSPPPHNSVECFPSVWASSVFCVWPIFSAALWIKLLRAEYLREAQSATSQLAPSCFQTEPFQIGFHKTCQFTGTSLENLPLSSAQPPGGVVAKEKVILNLNLQKGSFYKLQGGFRGESEGSWGEWRVRVVGGRGVW